MNNFNIVAPALILPHAHPHVLDVCDIVTYAIRKKEKLKEIKIRTMKFSSRNLFSLCIWYEGWKNKKRINVPLFGTIRKKVEIEVEINYSGVVKHLSVGINS